MKVFYINLDHRTDRNDKFIERNNGIADFERIKAVDGEEINIAPLFELGRLRKDNPMFPNSAIGCALSHEKAWDYAINNNTDVTVAQDDAIFNHHFSEKYEGMIAQLPADWDIILHGCNFNSILVTEILPGCAHVNSTFTINYVENPEKISFFQKSNYKSIPIKLVNALGTCCYTVSPKGAKFFKENCFPLRRDPIEIPGLKGPLTTRGLDLLMNLFFKKIKAFLTYPPLVLTENIPEDSDINKKTRPKKK